MQEVLLQGAVVVFANCAVAPGEMQQARGRAMPRALSHPSGGEPAGTASCRGKHGRILTIGTKNIFT